MKEKNDPKLLGKKKKTHNRENKRKWKIYHMLKKLQNLFGGSGGRVFGALGWRAGSTRAHEFEPHQAAENFWISPSGVK